MSVRSRRAIVAVVFGLAATLITVSLARRAIAKPFWHDEVYTILESQLPLPTLWRALLDGVDLQPPLNVVATRAVHAVAGVGPIATRVPAMAGFLGALTVIFLMVRRRANVWTALSAALLFCLTAAWRFGIEARGYGLSLGCFAVALYGWSEAAAGRAPRRHLTIMAIALAAGVWTHYYLALAFVPIAVGEAVRQIAARRWRGMPWLAMAAGAAGAATVLPLARVAAAQRGTFWAAPSEWRTREVYTYLLEGPADHAWWYACLVTAGLAISAVIHWRRVGNWRRRLAAHDVAVMGICLALPAAGLALGHLTNAFDPRYVVFTTVGLAAAAPLLAWSISPGRLADVAIAAVIAVAAVPILAEPLRTSPRRPDPLRDRFPILADWLRGSTPVALVGGVMFLETWHAIPEAQRQRVVYLADPRGQRRDTTSDTVDRGYLALARWTPLPVRPIDDHLGDHKKFWLYALEPNWALHTLRYRATLVEHAREKTGNGRLIEAEVFPPGGAPGRH